MDWSSIIAGGITGSLSGAVSGNLVQYVLDKRRSRNKNRHQLLTDWESLLNGDSLRYDDIISHASYQLLTSFIPSKSRRFIATLTAKTEDKRQALSSKIRDYYEIHEDELMALEGTKGSEERIWLIEEGSADWERVKFDIEQEAKRALVAYLRREILLLKKKWGML